MAIPPFTESYAGIVTELASQILPKQLVIVHPDQLDEIRAKLAGTEYADRIEVYADHLGFVEIGQAYVMPKPRWF
jgi:hypothetical protein